MAKNSAKVSFTKEKETKGAVKYQELDAKGQPVQGGDYVIGNLYIRKTAFNGSFPEKITVDVSW